MVLQGATTLWETWTGTRYDPAASWNHIMFGATTEFFFRHLAGIQQPPTGTGFSAINFKPSILLSPAHLTICANLSSVKGTMRRPHGEISASWECNDDTAAATGVVYNISVPVGVPASVWLPLSKAGGKTAVQESGTVIWDGTSAAGKVSNTMSISTFINCLCINNHTLASAYPQVTLYLQSLI
jgi:hypothetical protein